MQTTPKGLRLHIGIFGRRNVGKSSILNRLTGQQSSIVSSFAGTTTDPVEKPMELLPLGPVVFVDTAGVDDIGALGEERIKRTRKVVERTDLAILVATAGEWGQFELDLLGELDALKTPAIVVLNKADVAEPTGEEIAAIEAGGHPVCVVSAETGWNVDELRRKLVEHAPEDAFSQQAIVSDLVPPGRAAVLVVPIDKEAPKGRLILPQVQTIRDLLDGDAVAIVCKERELGHTLGMLAEQPAIVVTDSQAFLKVAADTPDDVPMTSFSVLFARLKGDLQAMAAGARAIEDLQAGDMVLIAESCTHHPIVDDIGTVKIPRWLEQYVGGRLQIESTRGRDFPDDLSGFKLVIHCGACMWNRRQMQFRILKAAEAGVLITNYGLAIAYLLGIFDRAIQPFGLA